MAETAGENSQSKPSPQSRQETPFQTTKRPLSPFDESRFLAKQPKIEVPSSSAKGLPPEQSQVFNNPETPETATKKVRDLMRNTLLNIRGSARKAGLTLTPEQELQFLQEIQQELRSAETAQPQAPASESRIPDIVPPMPTSGESQEQMAIRQLFKEYLTPAGGRKPHQHIAELLVDNRNRAVFASEWASAIQSAKSIKQLDGILHLGLDPHQVQILKIKLRAELKDVNPNAKDEFQDKKNYDYESWLPSQLLPEYDAVRKALAEKLQQDQTLSSFGRNSASALIPERLLSLPEDQFIKELLMPHQPQRP